LKDVFAVQTELAQTIVGQLSGQLTNGAADPVIQAQVQAAESLLEQSIILMRRLIRASSIFLSA